MEAPQPQLQYQDRINLVAQWLRSSQFLFIGAGAGMSADSGLAVYAQVSDMDFFARNNLTYRDVSDTRLLDKTPERFLGWSGLNVHKYRNTPPHEGYHILNRWASSLFSLNDSRHHSVDYTALLHKEMQENSLRPTQGTLPDRHFVFTTNVDGFFEKAGFAPASLCQTHGRYEQWQCSGLRRGDGPAFKLFDGPCVKHTWPVPTEYEMNIDEYNMNAPAGPAKTASTVRGFETNHPMCPHCGKYARPNVYQFGDTCFIGRDNEEAHLANWSHAVTRLLKANKEAKLVMLELGVGMRLPKIRAHFERILIDAPAGQALLVRINPEYATNAITPGIEARAEYIVSLPLGALSALQQIDAALSDEAS